MNQEMEIMPENLKSFPVSCMLGCMTQLTRDGHAFQDPPLLLRNVCGLTGVAREKERMRGIVVHCSSATFD